MKKALFAVLGLFVVAGAVAALWLYQGYQDFLDSPLAIEDSSVDYELTRGSSFASVGRDWRESGYIDSTFYYSLIGRLTPELTQLKAGYYEFSRGATVRSTLSKMVAGEVQSFSITLIPGWTFKQFRQALAADPVLEQTIGDKTAAQIMTELGDAELHPEGQFFPDTYQFNKTATDLDILRRAHLAMKNYLAAAWEKREEGLPYQSPYEALIMASIVEKETGLASERPAIAGVFVRRLNIGMRLQTDPTIIYGMGDRYNGNIRRKDILEATPYNTYVINGLPPTPIAMPGGAAIDAALHPEQGKALYFVARGDGSHQFSATLAEHNRAVRKYQLRRGK